MFQRTFWIRRIEHAWQERSVVWLAGVRRVGKTVLSQSLPDVEYYDCELPRVRRMLQDPESFLQRSSGKRIVLDEVHRLMNPSQLLKIAADHYPDIRILATGSSTLGASAKFRDTLAGRKRNLWLTPMVLVDLTAFQRTDLRYRLLRGGLPPFFLAKVVPERDFQEWMDAYWAKDIQELFRLERRASLQRFVELLTVQSGGIFEATRFA
ncbi:MAG TPA: ATPase, partial [Candidatus Acetothermia bacterium]|nr:ATPase [Candidatus Acetothermia bacterium]